MEELAKRLQQLETQVVQQRAVIEHQQDQLKQIAGDRSQALEEWERLVRQYEAQSSDTLQDTI